MERLNIIPGGSSNFRHNTQLGNLSGSFDLLLAGEFSDPILCVGDGSLGARHHYLLVLVIDTVYILLVGKRWASDRTLFPPLPDKPDVIVSHHPAFSVKSLLC